MCCVCTSSLSQNNLSQLVGQKENWKEKREWVIIIWDSHTIKLKTVSKSLGFKLFKLLPSFFFFFPTETNQTKQRHIRKRERDKLGERFD